MMKKIFLFFILSGCIINVYSQHTVVLKSGEKLNGVVVGIQYDTLSIAINYEITKVDMRKVSSIFFNEFVPYDGEFIEDTPEHSVKSGDYTIKYKIKERIMVVIPKISIGTEDKGTVVVLITVDRNGNVISAEPGGIGSNTSNQYLYTKAKLAAQEARFDKSPTGPLKTKGTITITY